MSTLSVITDSPKHSKSSLIHKPIALGVVYFICSCAFSFQQSSGPKEMDATIQSYWPRMPYSLRVDSGLVEVGVVVRDTHGRVVGGLTKDDFEINDAGKKPAITMFEVETFTPIASQQFGTTRVSPESVATTDRTEGRPRYVAILFDDFSMPFSQQFYVKAAARRFLKDGLAKGDRVGLFTTSGKQIVPFTSDVAALVTAVDRYNAYQRTPFAGICPKLTPYDAYVIANKLDSETFSVKDAEYAQCVGLPMRPPHRGRIGSWPLPGTNQVMIQAEAMWLQIRDTSSRALDSILRLVDYLGRLDGKSMILMASSGFLVGTLEREQQDVVNHALRCDVVINALDAKGLYTDDPPELSRGSNPISLIHIMSLGIKEKDVSNDVMAFLTRSTGGLFFDNNNDLDLGFRELGMVPEVSYLLGFSPGGTPDGKYHGLKVSVKSKNRYLIQARPGYWALERPELVTQERRIDREVMGTALLKELAAVISSEPSKTGTGDPALEVVINIDAEKFGFVQQNGVHNQRLVFIAALFDYDGSFVTGTELEVRFSLQESTFNRMRKTGIEMSVTLQAPPGKYRLRGVAQEGLDGKIVASTLPVQVR